MITKTGQDPVLWRTPKPAEIRQLLRGDLNPARSQELLDQMRAAGLPT